MRSAQQIGRTVGQYRDYRAAERQRILREVLAMLAKARSEGRGWYMWIVDGRPPLTREEYKRQTGRADSRGRR